MIIFYLLSLAVFGTFVTAIVLKYGVPSSISESYYLLPPKVAHPLFAGFCLLTAVPLMVFWFECTSHTALQFLVFFSCAPLMFVGAAAAFKQIELTRGVHFGAASMCAVFSQAWIAIYTGWWVVSIVLFVLSLFLARRIKGRDADGNIRSAWLFFVEIAAFASIYIALLAYYI